MQVTVLVECQRMSTSSARNPCEALGQVGEIDAKTSPSVWRRLPARMMSIPPQYRFASLTSFRASKDAITSLVTQTERGCQGRSLAA
jgi:hypothetical protein